MSLVTIELKGTEKISSKGVVQGQKHTEEKQTKRWLITKAHTTEALVNLKRHNSIPVKLPHSCKFTALHVQSRPHSVLLF